MKSEELAEVGLDDRKGRGAFFTPPEICSFIASWGIRAGTDCVFEPSCGEAAFALAAGERIAQLGGTSSGAAQLHGVDLHPESVARARRAAKRAGIKSTLKTGDFFAFSTNRRFDAVLGNPPYVRYQGFAGDARTRAVAAALAQGVRLTNLASSLVGGESATIVWLNGTTTSPASASICESCVMPHRS